MTSAERCWTRRGVVAGLTAIGGIMPAMGACSTPTGSVAVPDFRVSGDRDDTAAAQRAIATGRPVHFPAGRGSDRDGAYLLRELALRSGTRLSGDGATSVLRVADARTRTAIVAMSDTVQQPLTDIIIRDLRVEGRVKQTGFVEHWNLIWLSGVAGVRIDRVEIAGFTSDGLFLGAERQRVTREPRIIRDVIVSDCLFDGVNNDNRNAISVTGGSDITIQRCRFLRCTRPNMPGPIDFEPEPYRFYRLERLRVLDCDFQDCGGNYGQVAIMVPDVVAPPHDVLIADNRFRGYRGTGGDVTISINRPPDDTMAYMQCVIERNIGEGGYGGFHIFSGKGITIRQNSWTGYSSRSFLGFAMPSGGVMDASVADQFSGCGWREGIALALYKGDNVRVEGSRFTRSGNGRPGSAPIFLGPGRIRRLALVGNDLRNNETARGLVTVERCTDYLAGTTRITDNLLSSSQRLPQL